MDEVTNAAFSDPFLDRLCIAYERALKSFDTHGNSMWASIERLRHDIHSALVARDLGALGSMLANPLATKLYYGVDELYDHGTDPNPGLPAHYRQISREAILAIGYWMGLIRVPNPEGGQLYPVGGYSAATIDIESLMDEIDRVSNASLRFPNPFPGEIVLPTSRGGASVRAVAAFYQAMLIRRLSAGREIVEIGAGMGRTAFYALQAGVGHYKIVDLPLSLIGQAAFLALVLGEESVAFASEGDVSAPILLMTPQQFHMAAVPCSMVLNVDSIAEMDREHAIAYVERLRADGSVLLSINHEANDVRLAEIAPVQHRKWRAPYMLRPGYIEEFYDFSHGA